MNSLEQASADLESAAPQDILRWGYDRFGTNMALVTSFQITGIVTLHMLQDIAPDVPVLTLDTGFLFPETYALIEEIEDYFGISVEYIRPELSVDEQALRYGDELWKRQSDMCCHIRKVLPLRKALAPYDAWITGVRRDQSPQRVNTPILSWDSQQLKTKLAPFATWTEDMLWTYIQAYDLPYNKLHDQNYPSIGCLHCTRPVKDGEDKRSGRWSGRAKTECGIHLPADSDAFKEMEPAAD